MPLGKGVRYRYKKGTKVRLAFKGSNVVEAKNMKTGATHTPAEFAKDRAKKKFSKGGKVGEESAAHERSESKAERKREGEFKPGTSKF